MNEYNFLTKPIQVDAENASKNTFSDWIPQ